MYSLKQIKVKYIGKDRADIRNGDIYDASEVRDDPRYYGIVDRSGEEYAYPKSFFEIVTQENSLAITIKIKKESTYDQ